jgi:hypothetical protein
MPAINLNQAYARTTLLAKGMEGILKSTYTTRKEGP